MIGPHLDGEPYLSLGKFIAGWLPALAITSQIDPAPQLADALVLPIGGVPVPVVTCLLGLLGVLLARPLARKREARVGWTGWALVTAIMLVVVQLWIVEARPSALFAFVLAIGLGFSGYSLIELAGTETTAFLRRLLPDRGGPASSDTSTDPEKEDRPA